MKSFHSSLSSTHYPHAFTYRPVITHCINHKYYNYSLFLKDLFIFLKNWKRRSRNKSYNFLFQQIFFHNISVPMSSFATLGIKWPARRPWPILSILCARLWTVSHRVQTFLMVESRSFAIRIRLTFFRFSFWLIFDKIFNFRPDISFVSPKYVFYLKLSKIHKGKKCLKLTFCRRLTIANISWWTRTA